MFYIVAGAYEREMGMNIDESAWCAEIARRKRKPTNRRTDGRMNGGIEIRRECTKDLSKREKIVSNHERHDTYIYKEIHVHAHIYIYTHI